MAAVPPVCNFGWKAPQFTLPATDGKLWMLDDVRGENGTLIMFICNHCPYVLKVLDLIVGTATELIENGIGIAAISSNDIKSYPQDGPAHMVALAKENKFSFPYLYDENQDVARAYKAACTPDFFGFNASDELQYRGRLEEPQQKEGASSPQRDLYEAMKQISQTGQGPLEQIPSMGCSIKWKNQ